MECLYKTTTKFTIEEYRKFNRAVMHKNYIMVVTAIALLMIIVGGIVLESPFLIIFAILYPFLFFAATEIGVRRVFNSNKLLQNAEITYEFYEDYLHETHEGGEEKVSYDKFDRIIETKTNFYLMIAKNQGFMISKENMPDGLEEFIRGKKKA
jgi:hypothetical protein